MCGRAFGFFFARLIPTVVVPQRCFGYALRPEKEVYNLYIGSLYFLPVGRRAQPLNGVE